jgi:predicted amino acid-binding ACT domain protein
MTLAAVCGTALTLAAPAHAQSPKPLGAVLTVPIQSIGPIFALNALQNNVNILQVSQAAVGSFNTQVATLSIAQRNSGPTSLASPTLFCKLPKAFLPAIQQINNNTTIVDQTAVGDFNTQVATVEVAQSNKTYVPGKTAFMLVPVAALAPLQQLNQQNFNVVGVSQLAIGGNNTQVAAVAVDQSNAAGLQFPGAFLGSLEQLNQNVAVVNQTAVGNNNTQVATVTVNQANG